MKKLFVLLMVFGLLLSACGGEVNDTNDTPNVGEPLPPDTGANPETPIINLPGEQRFEDQPLEPGQGEWSRGNAFVNNAQLIIMESFPIQVMVSMEGELPTPCNKLTVGVSEPDANNNIHLEVYSLVNSAETCIQMIEPFAENVSLPTSDLADGTYSVFINGDLVGEFTYPGG
jgi:inhibitor of cysteine peptidase